MKYYNLARSFGLMFFLKTLCLWSEMTAGKICWKAPPRPAVELKPWVSLETNRLVFLPSCQTVTYPPWRPWKATIWIRDLSEARCCEGFRGKGWQRIWSDQRYAGWWTWVAVQPQWEPYKPPILQHVAMHDCEPYQGEMVAVVMQIPPPLRPKKPIKCKGS